MSRKEYEDTIFLSDSLTGLRLLPDQSVNCCVTSPPYWGLRDYGVGGQLGLEKSPGEYISKLVGIFDEVKRVLKNDGTLWLNIGDSYCGSMKGFNADGTYGKIADNSKQASHSGAISGTIPSFKIEGIKSKDLVGIPWMLAFALRDAGWYLRCDNIWSKKNCMPESVTDRPTKSHEYIFLLSKSSKYYYDQEAIKEPAIYDVNGTGTAARKARQNDTNKQQPTALNNGIRKAGFKDAALMNGKYQDKQRGHSRRHAGFIDRWDKMSKDEQCIGMRNKRSVWSADDEYSVWQWLFENAPAEIVTPLWNEFIDQRANKDSVWLFAPAQLPEAHFATFPEKLIVDCIKAGCPIDGIVLDPFMGAGTTALVAKKLQRHYVGFELNPEYIKIAENRLYNKLGMFA